MMKKIILAASAAIVMFACSGDRVGPNTEVTGSENGTKAVQKEKIYGVAQKGPFVNGKVVIYELDDKYEKTGKTFKGTTNDKGYFGIDITGGKLASPYIIIEASGKYVNEVTGKTTSDAITLKSVADVSNKENVNVNVLTDLESDKVIKLAKEGKSFDDAKSQAQGEVFKALGISESSVTRNSEDIALFGGNSSDSVLLVVSVSLQGNKTEAEVAGLLANLSGSGTFDVEKGLKDANVDMGKVKDHILEIEPSAVVPNISSTTPKAPTTSTNTNPPKQTTPSTPSYTPPTSTPSYTSPSTPSVTPSTPSTPAPTPVVPEKPICGVEKDGVVITENCVSMCGNWEYDPATDICKNGEVNKCGTEKYDPAKQFCTRSENNPKVVEKCGGKGYDTRTKFCTKSPNNPQIVEKCGGEGYDTRANVCRNNVVKPFFTDSRDGQKYAYVEIGEQVWMAENLNYDTETTGSQCYNNVAANCLIYGRIYNWKTTMAGSEGSKAAWGTGAPVIIQGVCPDGWHLPSDAEWTQLTDYIGGLKKAGTKLKANSDLWNPYPGTDDFGFSALPGSNNNKESRFWSTDIYGSSANNAYYRYISNTNNVNDMQKGNIAQTNSNSVRCVKGEGSKSKICSDKYYNTATHFCSGTTIYSKCGGKEYDPLIQSCSLDLTVYDYSLCGDVKYNPATDFCTKSENNPKVVPLCGGKGYDTRTKYCKNATTVQDIQTFKDERDGKTYKYVEIGDQTWMKENLNYAAEGSVCGIGEYGKYGVYVSENTEICDTYGRLYDWATAMGGSASSEKNPSGVQGVCPVGWHLPSQKEWDILMKVVGTGGKLKASSLWPNPGTDDYGFSALPGGNACPTGEFVLGYAYWWSTTGWSGRSVADNNTLSASVGGNSGNSGNLFSVRCLQD